MSRFNVELFIARRISSSAQGKANVMVRIATATVAIGIAVMIVALAVIVGFKKEITGKLVGFQSHVRIVNLDTNNSFETVPITLDPELMEEISKIHNFRSIEPYAIKGGIIRTPVATQGIALKGISTTESDFFRDNLIEGTLPQIADSVAHRDILISAAISSLLSLGVGDRVEILVVNSTRPGKRDLYKVCGIYSTGMDEMDKLMAFTDLRNVQRLNGWSPSQITGYEVMTDDFPHLSQFADRVYQTVFEEAGSTADILKVEDVVSLNPNIFDWLKAHNMNGIVIIVIMLTVALLNMASALLIILLEKTSMIGTLKALGMRDWPLQKIFLYRSLGIILKGMLWGNIIGIGICLIQKYTHLVSLNSSGYMLTHVPISLDWGWWLALNLGVPAVMALILMLPALVAGKIKPDRTMRFQ